MVLADEGFSVVVANSGEEALDILKGAKEDAFDSIVSDVYMPGMSGYELCKALKADPKLREIPFVLLTSRKEPTEIISGMECGADGFLTKPVEPGFIAGRLHSLIHNRILRRQGKIRLGVELSFLGRTFNITAEKEQILNLLITTFEDIHLTNAELQRKKDELLEAKAKVEDYARRIEMALDASQDQLRVRNQAINALDVAVVLANATQPQRPVEDANPAYERITGYSLGEALGQPLDLMEGPDTDRAAAADLRAAIEKRVPAAGTLLCYRKDGKTFWNDILISPVNDGHANISHLVVLMRDVSERRSLERQFAQAQKMEAVGQLTGGIAHDFNNLLTVILGNLDLLQEELQQSPRLREMIELAVRATLRGADLTRQLLAFSRRQTLEAEVIRLEELVNGTVQLLRRTLGERIEVVTRFADDLWPAFADPAQVESALANLAINARDAMPQGGRLTIEASNQTLSPEYAAENSEVAPGDYVMLAVTDTGTGIPSDLIDKVIEPFFTTKEDGKGTGLGLSMVYGFAKQSGGHFKIYSEVGHGTTMRLYLPRARGEEDMSRSRTEETLVETPRGLILIVEDNPDVRRVAVNTLASFGHRTLEAENAAMALEVLQQNQHIDLLFSDVVMPGPLSGLDLAKRAKEIRPDIKILLTSGFAKAAMEDVAGDGTPWPLLSKPYRAEELTRAVNKVLVAGK